MKQLATNEPLLYVKQPRLQKPKSYMQVEYISQEQPPKEKTTNSVEENTIQTSFIDLTIEEKINYLCNMPADLIQMKCKFITKNKTYYGWIRQKEESKIYIIHSGKQRAVIKIDDIQEINLIGL